jgi:trimethylamine--corrinoid protein Co-methyltransferase
MPQRHLFPGGMVRADSRNQITGKIEIKIDPFINKRRTEDMEMTIKKSGVTTLNGMGLNSFSRDELDTLHHGACHILKHTGILVEMEEAAERFGSAGATVEKKGSHWLVKIPEWLVMESIASVPKSVTYYARDPEKNFLLENRRVGFGTFGEQVNVIDLDTRECRNTTKADCNNVYSLIDALDGLAFCQRTICPGDKAPKTQAANNFHSQIINNSKHITIGMVDRDNIDVIIKMAAAAAGGIDKLRERPICTCSCCVISPLTLANQFCETLIASLEAGVNVDIMVMDLAGGTGPVTLAGTIVQTIAEHLSGLVLAQIVRKGSAVAFGSCSTIMDLKTGLAAVGAPEWSMVGSAIAQMGQYYKIPTRIGSGVSDSKLPDAQAAYEFTTNVLPVALSGANMIFGAGGIESGLTFDFAKLVMDHECITNIRKMLEGVKIDEETMALDLIDEIGPGGAYLTHQHTYDHMRSQSQGYVFDRKTREGWMSAAKGKDLTERAYEKAIDILQNHTPVPLLDGAKETINGLMEEFEAKFDDIK